MDMKILRNFVVMLVLIGMVLGVGVLTLDKFGIATKDSTTVSHEVISIASGIGATANDDVTSVTFFGNSTYNTDDDFTINTDVNWTTAGAITARSNNFTDGDYNISYAYDADSTTTTSMGSVVGAITPVATTWLPLIVTIMALGIILTLVIRSFGSFKR